MKKVFICSPLRGDMALNIFNAEEYSREVAIKYGNIPVCPHIYFTRFLDDDNEVERKLGMLFGCELLSLCDEMNVYGEPSEGMKQEIELAKELKIKINYIVWNS